MYIENYAMLEILLPCPLILYNMYVLDELEHVYLYMYLLKIDYNVIRIISDSVIVKTWV
jgi:hypothetical protein